MGTTNIVAKMTATSSFKQIIPTKKPSHTQSMLSKITVFKKKLEIDDE